MSKRNDSFEKVPKDFYPTTDPNAVDPLVPFIRGKTYAEPFYGEGDLEDLLMNVATCMWRSDIRETVLSSKVMPATDLTPHDLRNVDCIISNPPFTKDVLLPCIDHLIGLKPTWLLLPADMMHNKYFRPYMGMCRKVVSIGRVKWFKDSKACSTDNFSWYYWVDNKPTDTIFYTGVLRMITKEDIEAMADDTEVQLEFNSVMPKQVLDPYDDAPVVGDAYKQDFSNKDKETK